LHSKGFTTSDTLAGALKEFKEATDPLTVWLNEHVDDEATAFIPKRELMVAYNSACTAAKRAPMNGTAFGLALRRARPSLRDGQRTVAGKKTDVYLGIEWKRGCCVA
jgi:phage/plasmid-associated DNA primase